MIIATGWLPTLRCQCGSDQPITFDTGDEPEIAPGGVVIRAGRDPAAWCLACAMRRGWLIADDRRTLEASS